MKRIIALISALLCLTLLFGCKKEEAPGLGVPNPVSSSTLEAMAEETGHPAEAFSDLEGLSVRRFNLDPVLYELEFTGGDGQIFTLRLTSAEEAEDISGMHFTWTETEEKDGFTVSLDGSGHGICLWHRDGFAYSLALEQAASAQALFDQAAALN